MFNLNDPRWGRGDDNRPTTPAGRNRPDGEPPAPPPPPQQATAAGQGPNQGPPDLDELWRDFNRKLGGLFGGRKGGGPATTAASAAAAAAAASSPT